MSRIGQQIRTEQKLRTFSKSESHKVEEFKNFGDRWPHECHTWLRGGGHGRLSHSRCFEGKSHPLPPPRCARHYRPPQPTDVRRRICLLPSWDPLNRPAPLAACLVARHCLPLPCKRPRQLRTLHTLRGCRPIVSQHQRYWPSRRLARLSQLSLPARCPSPTWSGIGVGKGAAKQRGEWLECLQTASRAAVAAGEKIN